MVITLCKASLIIFLVLKICFAFVITRDILDYINVRKTKKNVVGLFGGAAKNLIVQEYNIQKIGWKELMKNCISFKLCQVLCPFPGEDCWDLYRKSTSNLGSYFRNNFGVNFGSNFETNSGINFETNSGINFGILLVLAIVGSLFYDSRFFRVFVV